MPWHNRTVPRNRKGTVTIEFLSVGVLLTIMGAVGVQCYLMLYAAWMNDAACRDAVRAAAQQTTADDAKKAAIAACKRFSCGTLGAPQVSTTGTDFEYQQFIDPATGKPQMDKGPFVRITTVASGQTPFNTWFNDAMLGGSITFKRTYIFPIVPI